MSKSQLRSLLAGLLPRIRGLRQRCALFFVVLILALSPVEFGGAHLHFEPEPLVPTTNVTLFATGNEIDLNFLRS
jgi:hypothetical protein